MNTYRLFVLAAILLLATSARADVVVHAPWVRGTVSGQNATGAFMDLTSATDMVLVGVASPAAKNVELHTMEMSADGMMKMRPLERLPLPAGKTVQLAPGGNHIMLTDLHQPLKGGERIPLTLTLEDAQKKQQTVQVQAEVRALGAPK
jgi:copper(I)-binding protein